MNRTLKEATVKKYHYQTHQQLKEYLQAFLMAHNFAKRLKTLRGLTPDEYICQCWQQEPDRLTLHPYYHTLGLNTAVNLQCHGAVTVTALPAGSVSFAAHSGNLCCGAFLIKYSRNRLCCETVT